jgi:hypothetical protein
MAPIFDPETLVRFRDLAPRTAFEETRILVYRSGGVTSEDFREAFEELVEHGILTWEQVEEFEG